MRKQPSINIEAELKLRIEPEGMKKLRESRYLETLATGDVRVQNLRNIYFDTPALDLHHKKIALRLRNTGDSWLQTLKGGGSVEAGLHSRNEWEAPVAGEALDLVALRAMGGNLPEGIDDQLRPLFSTDFTRTSLDLTYEGAVIEMSLDQGEIRAGQQTQPISEIELELKSGDPETLFHLGLTLLDIVPLQVETVNKAEYGYRLVTGVQPGPVRSAVSELDTRRMDLMIAMRALVSACVFQVQGNISGVLYQTDEEFLHQLRVGLRRLQVTLGMVAKLTKNVELEALKTDVSQLCSTLGELRDWDVLVIKTLPSMRRKIKRSVNLPEGLSEEVDSLTSGLKMLLYRCKAERAAHAVRLHAILSGSGFQRLILRLGAMLYSRVWHEPSKKRAGKTLKDFADGILERQFRKFHRVGLRLKKKASTRNLHELRIACKKLRYIVEMHQNLYDGRRVRTLLSRLSKLQESLGIWHDLVVAEGMLQRPGAVPDPVVEYVASYLNMEESHARNAIQETWSVASDLKPFWG